MQSLDISQDLFRKGTKAEYRTAGHLGYETGRDCITAFISDTLSKEAFAYCLFENTVARPKDPWINAAKSIRITYENEVYHAPYDNDAGDIRAALIEADSAWMLVGFIIKEADQPMLEHGQQFRGNQISGIAEHITHVIASAFDGDWYILWQI